MDGGLEPLRLGHLPLVEREPLYRPAVREVGARFVRIAAGDSANAEDGLPVAGEDDISLCDRRGEVEDLVGRLADLLGVAGYRSPSSWISFSFDAASFSKLERSSKSAQPIATQPPSRMSDHRFLGCCPSEVPIRQ